MTTSPILLAGGGDCPAQVVNGSFETGDLSNWVPGVAASGGAFGSAYATQLGWNLTQPTNGSYMAYLVATAENAGYPFYTEADVSIEQSFFAGAGDAISLDWASDFSGLGGTAWGEVYLRDPGSSAFGLVASISPFVPEGELGWHRESIPLEAGGDYSLRIVSTASFLGYGDPEDPFFIPGLESATHFLAVDRVVLNSLSSSAEPLLPTTVLPGDNGGAPLFVFQDALSGQWFDPPTASGFHYKMTSGDLFTAIAEFPSGFSNPFVVSVDGQTIGSYQTGEQVDFSSFPGGGVAEFSITGLEPLVDSDDVSAFPLRLTFSAREADFTMQAIAAVPEPSSLGLAGLALASLAWWASQKRRGS